MADQPRSLRRGAPGNAGRTAAAVGAAVLDAAAAHSRPLPVEDIRQIETVLPQPSGDAYQAGRGLLAAGDVTGAIAAFRQALIVDPQSVDALNGLGVAYDSMGRYDLSQSFYDVALAIDPGAPLVANNLGYSLFLQGELRAAIPWLQRAAASGDPAAAAGGQRLLGLIAVRLRTDAAEAGTAIARAEIGAPAMLASVGGAAAAPTALARRMAAETVAKLPGATADGVGGAMLVTASAHIEPGVDGEQRLVLDNAPVADRGLLASLGAAATLTTVPRPWTAADDRAVARQAAAQDRATALAGIADLADLAAAEAAQRPAAPMLLAEAGDHFPLSARERPRNSSDTSPVAAAVANPGSVAANSFATTAATTAATAAAAREAGPPGWLLASRGTTRPAARALAGQGPQINAASGFDSDDAELNAFAARMRAGSAATASDGAAVARLATLTDWLERG